MKEAAAKLQAAIKMKQVNPLYSKMVENKLEDLYEEIDNKVPVIQAAIKRKIANMPKKNQIEAKFSTGPKNVYPQEGIYDRDKLKETAKEIMSIDKSVSIKLNASNSDLINFISDNGYKLSDVLKGFKPTVKRTVGRPKKTT